jgi:hypothetical protein
MEKTKNIMTVLHDWDTPYYSGKSCIILGIKYLIFGICKKIGVKPRFLSSLYMEKVRKAELIAMLDKLVGVQSIFGLRDCVETEFPEIKEILEKRYSAEVRKHIHIGENYRPDRKRIWIPPLNQPENTWHYDSDYVNGNKIILKEDELPIWHVGADPTFIDNYIQFLYDIIIKKEILYEKPELILKLDIPIEKGKQKNIKVQA